MAMACTALLVGCASDWDAARAARTGLLSEAQASESVAPSAAASRVTEGFAALPDRGQLTARDNSRRAQVRGAHTAYPVRLSEEHALNATHAGGKLVIDAPDGQTIELEYERHVTHPDGNWTWIGRGPDGADAVITFGDAAAFGVLPRTSGEPLRLTMAGGRAWLVDTDSNDLPDRNRAVTRNDGADYLVPAKSKAQIARNKASTATFPSDSSITFFADPSTIDLVVGYTTGFESSLGGESQAVTRIQYLVDIANQAYANSMVDATLRLVGTMRIDYPDNTDNKQALEELSGRGPRGTRDRAFAPLRAAREVYGADLVSLVRHFNAPQNNGCGIAWMIGGGQAGIGPDDAAYGYSVVSDGADVDESDGGTYFCRDESLVHELGHNMGQAHNIEDSGASGIDAYAYGHRETMAGGFYTVMAYQLPQGDQVAIRHFANPYVDYDGRPTGIANVSDNARSMRRTLPVVAQFRASVDGDSGDADDGSDVGDSGDAGDGSDLGDAGDGTELGDPDDAE